MAITPKGLEVELRFFEQDPNDDAGSKQGWVCHRIEAMVGSEVVGYIKIEYVPASSLAKFPTAWHWRYALREWSDREMWAAAHRNLGVVPAGVSKAAWEITEEDAPESNEAVMADLVALQREPGSPLEEFEGFRRNHVDRPRVAYIHVSTTDPFTGEGKDWRRKGIATLLYVEAAKRLAREKGLPLWASTLQEECAGKTWESMVEAGYPIKERPVPWDPDKTVYVMDFNESDDHGA